MQKKTDPYALPMLDRSPKPPAEPIIVRINMVNAKMFAITKQKMQLPPKTNEKKNEKNEKSENKMQ